MNTAILLIQCKDAQGIVAATTEFLFRHKGNIISLQEHVDASAELFFCRVAFELADFELEESEFKTAFQQEVAERFQMQWSVHDSAKPLNMALFVTKASHCLFDILARTYSKEWSVNIPLIISNHEHLRDVADQFNIPFHHFPITKANKLEQEEKQLQLLADHNIDFVVLARYMQIISPRFIEHYQNQIINIHHSFLPAFPGAKPYHKAHSRGVKIIGATGHYVTEELDAGPIIEQQVTRVSHRDSVSDLIRKGRDMERTVLSQAIWLHLQHKVMAVNNRTIIFN